MRDAVCYHMYVAVGLVVCYLYVSLGVCLLPVFEFRCLFVTCMWL